MAAAEALVTDDLVPVSQVAESLDSADPNTHFVFQHRVFQLPDARFELSGRERAPVMRVTLGDLDAVIQIDDVASEFGIMPDSSDGKEYHVTDAQHESIMELIAPMSVDDNGALAV